jgi:ABC-type transporter Mla subunit MlaD
VLAVSRALSETFGLVATFGGIGIVVNVIVVYIVIQVRGEHEQNETYRAERQRRFGS